uniref:Uncharacterized protein n=1 Tax=Oryza meridionalis TaxID=40149 RepID=A0A0E0E1P1_9ORYZ
MGEGVTGASSLSLSASFLASQRARTEREKGVGRRGGQRRPLAAARCAVLFGGLRRGARVVGVGGLREDGVDDSEEGEDEVVREVSAVGLELGVEVGNSISKVLWMATLSPTSLPNWNRMRISVNIITQNRAKSLRWLLASLRNTYYVGDKVVPISFNMDSRVDVATLNAVNSSDAEPLVLQQLVPVTNYIVFLDMLYPLYICTQQQDLSIVMNLLYIKARALLIHHRWKMESILDHMLREGRDRMLREAGVVIQQQQAEEKNSSGGTAMAPPPPRPGSSVTCYVCFEEVSSEANQLQHGQPFRCGNAERRQLLRLAARRQDAAAEDHSGRADPHAEDWRPAAVFAPLAGQRLFPSSRALAGWRGRMPGGGERRRRLLALPSSTRPWIERMGLSLEEKPIAKGKVAVEEEEDEDEDDDDSYSVSLVGLGSQLGNGGVILVLFETPTGFALFSYDGIKLLMACKYLPCVHMKICHSFLLLYDLQDNSGEQVTVLGPTDWRMYKILTDNIQSSIMLPNRISVQA